MNNQHICICVYVVLPNWVRKEQDEEEGSPHKVHSRLGMVCLQGDPVLSPPPLPRCLG